MKPFSWIQIDKVRYEWDGEEQIHCHTAVGYQNTLPGHQLLGVEIEGQDGELAGELQVDFAAGQLRFVPSAGAVVPDDQFIELGDGDVPLRLPLSDIAWQPEGQDFLDWSLVAPDPDLWSLLIGPDGEPQAESQISLTMEDLLYDADVSPPLDELFAQQDDMARGHTALGFDDVSPAPSIELPDILPPGLDV